MAGTVDVGPTLAALAEVLRAGEDRERCRDALAVLWRWHRDPDLSETSRRRAQELLALHGRSYAEPGRGTG